jgi:putative phosphoesterase
VERLIHCGDITTADIVALFKGWQVIFTLGNLDGDAEDRGELTFAVGQFVAPDALRFDFTAEIEGARIAACHGHDHACLSDFIHGGRYDYVFHGHTHRRRDERFGVARVINPGALGGTRYESRSACVLDLPRGEVEFIDLGG